MEDESRPIAPDERERLKPRMQSHSLPVPPLIPIVAVVALILGIGLGYGMAPKAGPTVSAAPLDPAATPTATAPIALYVPATVPADWLVIPLPTLQLATPDALPSGGLTLAQAISAAKAGWTFSDSDVISARIVQRTDVVTEASSPGQWVWEVVIRGPGPMVCTGPLQASDSPEPLTSCALPTSVSIDVDYVTGDWLYATAGSGN